MSPTQEALPRPLGALPSCCSDSPACSAGDTGANPPSRAMSTKAGEGSPRPVCKDTRWDSSVARPDPEGTWGRTRCRPTWGDARGMGMGWWGMPLVQRLGKQRPWKTDRDPSLPPRGPAPCSPPVSPAGRRPQCPLSSHPPQSVRAGAPGKALEEELERVEQGPGRALKFMSIPVTSDMTLLASKFFANIIITG